MMPKFGNITNPGREVVQDIHTIADMGFDFVELNFVEPEGLPEIYRKKANRIRNAIKQHGMFAYAHALPFIDFGCIDKSIRNAWLQYSKNLIDISKQIGIQKLNFHAHTRAIRETHSEKAAFVMKQERMKNFISIFNTLVSYGERKGVKILYENTWENPDEFAYIHSKVKGLKLNLDVGHAFILGEMPLLKRFLRLGKKIEHMHVHDNRGEKDDHLPLGKGFINFLSVARILKKNEYDKTITFEVFTSNRRSPEKSLRHFKYLLVKA